MFRRSSRLMKGRLANAALRVVGSGISWAARAIVLVVRVPLTRRSRSSSVSQVLAIVAPYALFNSSFDDRPASLVWGGGRPGSRLRPVVPGAGHRETGVAKASAQHGTRRRSGQENDGHEAEHDEERDRLDQDDERPQARQRAAGGARQDH